MTPPDRLDALVRQRDDETQKDILSFVIIQWGITNTLGMWIYTWVWTSLIFWVFWMPASIVLMVSVISWKARDQDRALWGYQMLPRIWVAVLSVLPVLIWFFPGVLHLYPESWIYSLTAAWASLGMYATGVFVKRWPVAVGAMVWLASTPFYFFIPGAEVWIFTAANILGLVVPGLVSRRGRRP